MVIGGCIIDLVTEPSKIEDSVDENGIRTTVEYILNDEGRKVKVTRRTKRTLQKSVVDHTVAERQKWSKFGAEKGHPAGPDRATTTIAENVTLKLSAGNKVEYLHPPAVYYLSFCINYNRRYMLWIFL